MDKETNNGEEKKSLLLHCIIQSAVGLAASLGFVLLRTWPEEYIDQVKLVCDAVSIVALLFLCLGSLLWVSTTGFFDIFGFAFKRALHAFIPGMVRDNVGDYYEYKVDKELSRKKHTLKSTFLAGAFLMVIAVALTIYWCVLAGEI